LGEKFEPVQTKEPNAEDKGVPLTKYNNLKRKFSELRDVRALPCLLFQFLGVLTNNQRVGTLKLAT